MTDAHGIKQEKNWNNYFVYILKGCKIVYDANILKNLNRFLFLGNIAKEISNKHTKFRCTLLSTMLFVIGKGIHDWHVENDRLLKWFSILLLKTGLPNSHFCAML